MKRILLGISGSISAYKAADLTSELGKLGYHVTVIMTNNSTQFITPLTLQVLSKNTVYTEVMNEQSPEKITHIELAKQTDLFIVAPASANILAKLANGIADDMLSTVALALPQALPKFIAPAMNTQMYQHPLTQKNLQQLKKIGYQEIEPQEAVLACGDFGKGALAKVEKICQIVHQTAFN